MIVWANERGAGREVYVQDVFMYLARCLMDPSWKIKPTKKKDEEKKA
jgi:hypothetical protein